MKYANEARAEGVPVRTGEILYEAMPWLKQVTGKTIVIKYGGSAMENPQLAAEVMADIVLLKILGVNPVLVHGGGKAINRAFAKFDLPVEFVDGQRVTTDDAMDLVRMVLTDIGLWYGPPACAMAQTVRRRGACQAVSSAAIPERPGVATIETC